MIVNAKWHLKTKYHIVEKMDHVTENSIPGIVDYYLSFLPFSLAIVFSVLPPFMVLITHSISSNLNNWLAYQSVKSNYSYITGLYLPKWDSYLLLSWTLNNTWHGNLLVLSKTYFIDENVYTFKLRAISLRS